MAKRKLSERQEMKKQSGRAMKVYKRDDMLQNCRHELTIREQKCVLYAISKIKPSDTAFQEYTFDLKDFYTLCGLQDESYTELKAILKGLSDRSWWAEIDDKGTESVLRWFTTVRTNKRSGKVTIKFHEDMMPFLLQLVEQNTYYTGYEFQYVLPMSSQYSPRLYELLKSYQKNNWRWFFDIETLKRQLNCQTYTNFYDFRRRVLEPAVEEINKFTDLKIAYEAEKEGRRVARIHFYMAEKKADDLMKTKRVIAEELDGQMTIFESEESQKEFESSVKAQFFKENFGKDPRSAF